MDTCSELSDALERHLSKAAPADEDLKVRAHLATCAHCSDYVRQASALEAKLLQTLDVSGPDPRWERVQVRLRAHRRGRMAMTLGALVMLGLAPPVALGWSGDTAPDRWWMALAMVGMAAAFLGGAAGDRLVVARAVAGDVFAWAHQQARRERRAMYLVFAWFAGTSVMCAAMGVRDAEPARYFWVPVAVLQGGVAIVSFRRLTALRREARVAA